MPLLFIIVLEVLAKIIRLETRVGGALLFKMRQNYHMGVDAINFQYNPNETEKLLEVLNTVAKY